MTKLFEIFPLVMGAVWTLMAITAFFFNEPTTGLTYLCIGQFWFGVFKICYKPKDENKNRNRV